MKRRAAVEPSIGHLKNEHRLERNRLRGTYGNAINAMLAIRGQLQLILTPIGPLMSSQPI